MQDMIDRARAAHLLAVLYCLTAATGLIDAVPYLGLGHVLVANMTGNIVFLGFALVGAKGFSAQAFLVALGSFVVGAVAGGRIAMELSARRRRWLTTTSAIETVLVTASAIASAAGALGPNGSARFGIVALLGVGTGMQNATVRRLSIPDLTTTVLTLTLTGLAADSSLARGDHPRQIRRATSVAAMFAGAIVGGALMLHSGITATLAVLAGVLTVVTLGFATLAEP